MLFFFKILEWYFVGINTSLPPVYLNEISPTSLRGAVGALHELSAVTGMFIAQILGLPYILGNDWGWPLLLGASALPVLFQLIALPFCPESPRYLFVEKHDEEAAQHGTVKVSNNLIHLMMTVVFHSFGKITRYV